jgi:predicted  nucleic acid-binding Zn-ribbon protein
MSSLNELGIIPECDIARADELARQHAEIEALKAECDALAKRMSRCKNDLRVLRNAVDAMMAEIEYHGAIGSRDCRVQKVMDALAASDWAAVFSADEEQDEQP